MPSCRERCLWRKRLVYEPSTQHRPDLRVQRHMILSRVSSKVFARYRIGVPSLGRSWEKSDALAEVRHAVMVIEDFLNTVRRPVIEDEERAARRYEIIDYMLYSWREKNELTALFDSTWYISRSVGEDVPMNPFLHYLEIGAARGDSCHPLFDTDFYCSQVHGRAIKNPFIDYLAYGWREKLSPHPLFDVPYYLNENADVVEHDVEPLTHYLIYGAKEGRNPHWAFDTRHYQQQSPEIMINGVNPLVDFVVRGAGQGLSPNPNFDIPSYLQHFPEVAASGVNPLIHWVESVRERLRKGNPIQA